VERTAAQDSPGGRLMPAGRGWPEVVGTAET